jgi:GWxTD domain-containing protein
MRTLALGAIFHSRSVRRTAWTLGMVAAALTAGLWAASSGDQDSSSSSSPTISRPLTKSEQRKKEQALRKELEGPWERWLKQDVVYIITDEERAAFHGLQTDEEKQQFVEQFWLRRDPTPDTEENEYKEEHYRRIAYANDHFASGIPGWKTDRGMIYIKYGAPDEIDSHPSGGSYERPIEEGGGETSTYPFEQWRYRYIEGVGTNIIIEFVDTTMSGEYKMTMDPSEKDALLYVPGAGLSLSEQIGLSNKTQRFQRTDGTHLATGTSPLPESMDEFTRINQWARLQRAPQFKDLNAVADSTIRYNTLPMQVHIDYIKITDATDLCNITIQFNNNELQYATKEGMSKATVNLYGRITSLSRRPVNWFEDSVEVSVPSEMLQQAMSGSNVYFKSIPIPPGAYRLNIAAKDVVGGTLNNTERALNVPHYGEGQLGSISVILADQMERVPANSIGAGNFVIRSSKVRPRVSESFRRDEKMGIYAEFYNFGMDEKTRKPDGTVEYEVVNTATNQSVFTAAEELGTIQNASPSLVIVEKFLPLNRLEPGSYSIRMKAVDRKRNETLTTPPARFTVTS